MRLVEAHPFLAQFMRRAVVLADVPKFTGNPDATVIGGVRLAAPGEDWPHYNGLPMRAVAQFKLKGAHWIPDELAGIELFTLFLDMTLEPMANLSFNGDGWCLRAYESIASLVPLPEPPTSEDLWEYEAELETVENDLDSRGEGNEMRLLAYRDEHAIEGLGVYAGHKLGGRPNVYHEELDWGVDSNYHYAIQIDSDPDIGFEIGMGAGRIFLARGGDSLRDWAMLYQKRHNAPPP